MTTNLTPSDSYQALLKKKISERSAVIGIVGLGYVGQPLTLRFAEEGFKVLGFDISDERVAELNTGFSSIEHISNQRLLAAVSSGSEFTTEMSRAAEVDVLVLCLPTPLKNAREPDLSFVLNTLEALLPFLRRGQALSLESTTYPGTTTDELAPRVSGIGLNIGEDFFLIYSPEREDPGNQEFTTQEIPKIVSGFSAACLEVAEDLYGAIVEKAVSVSSPAVAEMTKLLENTYRAINIGLANEMKLVADQLGLDIFEVIDAAATKPFGFAAYYPGPGIGGHCIPIDPYYLSWKAKLAGVDTRFIELAGEVNRAMPGFVIAKLENALAQFNKQLFASNILVLGLAYKKNVDDVRESPAVEIIHNLSQAGCHVAYSDPHVDTFPVMRKYHYQLTSEAINPSNLESADAVIIATDHDAFDFEMVLAHSKCIVDARGVYRANFPNVYRA